MASGGTCVFFILYIKSIAICQPLSCPTHEPDRKLRCFDWNHPKTSVGVVRILLYTIIVQWKMGRKMNSGIQFWGLFSTMYFYPLGTETYHQVHFGRIFAAQIPSKRSKFTLRFTAHLKMMIFKFAIISYLSMVPFSGSVCGQFWGGYKVGPYQL